MQFRLQVRWRLFVIYFAVDNTLITSDIISLQDVATYASDDGAKMSWVDHILSGPSVDNLLSYLCTLNDVISDHKPVSFIISAAISNTVIPI